MPSSDHGGTDGLDATPSVVRSLHLPADFGHPTPGERLADTYRIVQELGSGAMGTVMLAVDEKLDRRVAIKFLDIARGSNEERFDQLRREARAMARVRHPNVVQIHAFGEHHGVPYFVMEYVPGRTLDPGDSRWRSLDASIAVLEQLCCGLEAIHAAGAVHNDFKPGNVLVGPGARVFVTDFGLSLPVDRAQQPYLAGTPAYLSPEVARSETVAPALVHRRDIYALGVIAYELLVGRRPFAAGAMQGLLQQHAYEPPPAASTLRPDLPPGFDALFERVLVKDPAARTPSAQQFRRELLELQRLAAEARPPLRIFVVEDDAASRAGMIELLHEEFPTARIEGHADGDSAHAAACREPPDVVVTDLHMPGRGGVGLTTALRSDDRTRHVPIVVVTGLGGARDWEILRRLGADRFLIKPVAVDSLVAAIRAVVVTPPAPPPRL